MLNILLIGSGAREHAIARSIKKSSQQTKLFNYASNLNPGLVPLCEDISVNTGFNNQDILEYAKSHNPDFVFIGPEAPLEIGVTDTLEENGFCVIAPNKELAQIETSKAFARDLLFNKCPNVLPKYQKFTECNEEVKQFLGELQDQYVIKADGLMGGKGVKISGEHLHTHTEALDYCKEILKKGQNFVIEEKLIGVEFSLMSFTDGKTLAHMPAVQDHKRAYIKDAGPNTGGMGSYTSADHKLPFLSNADIQRAREINEITVRALNEKFNTAYKGILYGGFMKTCDGIKLIEYNARFGDPEVVNLLALLETDFVEICLAIKHEKLASIDVIFSKKASVCKYVVPNGYPTNPIKNQPIDTTQVTDKNSIHYASVAIKNKKYFMLGSRAIAVVAIANDIQYAEKQVEATIAKISGEVFHRPDIATQQLLDTYVQKMSDLTKS
ncbi:MAG: phosphoribosylamine--glycine ligase [Thiotrichales bacterium]|nr:MAG: phosphoribosylamine--glycine ligase [Thiotrichales bacterium]